MTTATALDDQTTNAVRQALSAASRGMLAEACQIGERALAGGGDIIALNAMLGMLRCQAGQTGAGIGHLRIAHAARPADGRIAINLANALAADGQHRQALDILTAELAQSDVTGHLLKLRGFLAQNAEEFLIAIAAYEQIVGIDPTDWESWNNLGNARRGVDDSEGALAAASRAVQLSPNTPPVRLNYASALEYAGKFEEAAQEYRRMAADFPDDVNPVRELFQMFKTQYRDEEAVEAIEEAVRRAPNDVDLILALASHRLSLLKHSEAENGYRQALSVDPRNKLAYLGIATILDLTNRTEELSILVLEAERAGVDAAGISFLKAFDHRRARRFAEGLAELRQVPDDLETARRQQLLGQLLEGAGDHDASFAAFERMNEIMRQDPSQPEQRAAGYRESLRNQMAQLTPDWRTSWAEDVKDARPAPAFLVGFPRSGTTLLDTLLMGHPATEVLEEEPTLMKATEALGGFEAVAGASGADLRKARDAYFDLARLLTPLQPGKLLVDKNPLAMNSVPVIRRLFPDARIILALRHPCDVVLSCFVTNFKPNNGMVNFLRLETAAELYDLSFSHFFRSCELLHPSVHTVSYENVVEHRERELRALLDFLGLPWDEGMLDHQSTARGRGLIKTASYAQVVEPIYQRSAGRWQHFRKHLEPIFPVLQPWVDKFGYSLDPVEKS